MCDQCVVVLYVTDEIHISTCRDSCGTGSVDGSLLLAGVSSQVTRFGHCHHP